MLTEYLIIEWENSKTAALNRAADQRHPKSQVVQREARRLGPLPWGVEWASDTTSANKLLTGDPETVGIIKHMVVVCY